MGMAKYDRLLHILNLLRSRKNLTANSLARECEVTERSIYRDIISLSEANVPIYFDKGYKLASGNFLPPLNFNLDEYRFLKVALESSPLNLSPEQKNLGERIRAKIEAGLSDPVRKEFRFSPRTTHVDIPVTVASDIDENIFATLEKAINTFSCISLQYDSISSGVSERIVEPYFIIFKARAFYFVGYCRLRQDFRTFRIDRIKSTQLHSDHFVKKDSVTPQTYFEGSWQVFAGKLVEVVIRFQGTAARVVQSSMHHPGESMERHDNHLIYTVTIRGLEEIQRWILGFGSDAEVISPIELRQNLATIGTYLAEAYRTDP